MESRKFDRRELFCGRVALAHLQEESGLPPQESQLASEHAAEPLPDREYFIQRFGRRAMACQFEVMAPSLKFGNFATAAVEALNRIDEVEALLSIYRPQSPLSQVNQQECEIDVTVDLDLFQFLQLSKSLFDQTAGTFDVTAGPLVRAWGFHQRQGRVPSEEDIAVARSRVGSEFLSLDPKQHTVRFLKEDMEVNPGAIGKGFALDGSADVLTSAGITDFLCQGGQSSVLARGSMSDDATAGWTIGIQHPIRRGERVAQIRLRDRALATSGASMQFFRHQGKRYGHILDPRTGWPADGVFSCTVIAPTAAEADALSTAMYVMGPEQALSYCSARPEIAMIMFVPSQDASTIDVVTAGFALNELTFVPARSQ